MAFLELVVILVILGGISLSTAYFSHKRLLYLLASTLFVLAALIWLWKTRVIFESVVLGILSLLSFLRGLDAFRNK